ncbi:MAG: DUF1990 family protein [Microbacteriaceae bacterium]
MKLELWEQAVTYAAVGATQAPDLLPYPPAGYRPIERRVRIGHGQERFDWACTSAMSWGIQKNSGMVVEALATPAEVSHLTYRPVAFDDAGDPVTPAVLGAAPESMFGPDGTPFVVPGDSAVLHIPFGPLRVRAYARVVYVVDEPNRKGFAYGTLPGHPEKGEEAFIVEQQEDGSVWLRIRAFSRPAHLWWWPAYPVLRIMQEIFTRRYERSLAGVIPG